MMVQHICLLPCYQQLIGNGGGVGPQVCAGGYVLGVHVAGVHLVDAEKSAKHPALPWWELL